MEEFELNGREFIELCDLLKILGLCSSGGTAKLAINEGRVIVDGQVELRKRCKLRSGQVAEFAGQRISIL